MEARTIAEKGDGWEALAAVHRQMKEKVRLESQKLHAELEGKRAEKEYACSHTHLSGTETKANTRSSSTPSAILVSRRRDMKALQKPTTLSDIVASRYHLVLGNVGDEVVVFGTRSALELLATTPVVQCDGTFQCCPPGFSQLYIFHGLVNNVSYPLMYALVKGKDQATYKKLFGLVETIAETNGVTLFNRPVDVLVDFEKAAINEPSP